MREWEYKEVKNTLKEGGNMKVLITGGYGFIGSHVADRFYKEGYEVYIIDNLSSGKRENIAFKHKGYILSTEDSKCEEVLRANRFDVVVHLAAQVSVKESITNPRLDSESNVLGLVNMLSLAKKYKVTKLLFASSAAVYGMNDQLPLTEVDICSPISPYGISKWVGETYCRKWKELYELDSVCFRFSNVYGPRQGSEGEGGVISVFMNQLMSNQPLNVHGDGEQTRDFIYVEDVADAIYRASYTNLSGIYNLSTNTECSVNSIVGTLKSFSESIEINYSESREGDIYNSCLSNGKIKNELDWAPKYNLKEGLHRTYIWFQLHQVELEKASTLKVEKSILPKNAKVIQPYLENLLGFVIFAWIVFSNQSSIFQTMDVGIFYITIIGVMYGNRQSILAAVLSICLLVYERLAEGREMVSLLYDTSLFFQTAVYLFVGLVVGYAIQRKNNVIYSQKYKMEELGNRYEFLNEVYTDVREVKDELQLRILNSGDSFGKVYSIIKELEGVEPEKVFMSTVNVVKSIMNVKNVSIYSFNDNFVYMRLIAQINDSDTPIVNSLKVEEHFFVQHILEKGQVYINKNLNSEAPIMAAPIYHNNKITAIITIDGIGFDDFSLYHENLFKITTEMVESALSRAFNFIEATEGNRYIPNTLILKNEVFQEILSSKRLAKEKNRTPYLLLEGFVEEHSLVEYSIKVANLLRDNDYLGLDEDGKMIVLLSNSTEKDGDGVLSRFEKQGIEMKVLEGVV